jgi:hypothetical protein
MDEYKLSYTGAQVNAKLSKIDSLAEKSELPTKTSELTNDSGFITGTYVENYAQPKGDYALVSDIPEVPVQSVNGQTGVVALSASDVGALPDTTVIPTVPTNVSAFTNDAGYLTQHQSLEGYAKTADLGALSTKDTAAKTDLTSDVQASLSKADSALQSYTETDPTVPAWAKAATKPTYTASEVGAAASSHNHDERYYTESEIDDKLESKSDTTHNHDALYDAKGAASESLASAKSYTDTKTSGLASTTVVDNKISSHNTSTSAHSDIRELISGLTTRLNTLANSDDTTLDQMSEVVAYIKNNKSLIDGITTSKVNVSDIVNNLTTNVNNKPLSAAQGVAIKGLIDALQSELDSHTHATATTSIDGFMSASDKTKLDGIATGATKVTVDSALNSSSTNPVQNKVVNTAINNLSSSIDTKVETALSEAKASGEFKGDKGDKGDTGAAGVSISNVKQTTTSTADDGNNIITVTLSNGATSTFTVQNGSKGSTGAAGSNGYTPVRGTDYWTDADKAEIKSYVDEAILGGAW